MPDPVATGAASITPLDNRLADVANDPNDLESGSLIAAKPSTVVDYDNEPEDAPAPETPVAPVGQVAPPASGAGVVSTPASTTPSWDDPANPYYQAVQQQQIAIAAQQLDVELQQRGITDETSRRALIGIAVREHAIEQQARTTVLSKASVELKELGFDFTPAQLAAFDSPVALQTFMNTMRTQKRATNFAARKENAADMVDSSQVAGGVESNNYSGGLIAQGLREFDRRSGRR